MLNVLKYLAGYLACKLLTQEKGLESFETKDFEAVYVTAKKDEEGRKIFYAKDLIHSFKSSESEEYIRQYLRKKLDIYKKIVLVSYSGSNAELMNFLEALLKTLGKKYWKQDAETRENIWLKKMKVIE